MSAAAAAVLDDPGELARFTRWGDDGVATSTLRVAGMHCAACAGDIETALRAVPGVIDAEVAAASASARVRWQPTRTRASALVAAVQAAGYDAAPDTAAEARALRRAERRTLLWRVFVAWFCAMQVMMLAVPVYVAGPGGIEPDVELLLHRSAWTLSLPVLLFSAAPFFAGAWRALGRGRVGMDVPVALGMAVAFGASSVAAFDPAGPLGRAVWFDALTMFVALLLAARWLEASARDRAASTVEALAFALPRVAWRIASNGAAEAVPADRLVPGDHVRVPLGEAFPADGRLEADMATVVDEALLSGESGPVDKAPGDAVLAGSVNRGVPVVVVVERTGADTRLEQIAALMREALTRRPAAVRLADRIAGPFLVVVLVAAAAAAAWWWPVDPARAVGVAVAVLIATCPCALALAAPSAQLAAAAALARRGVLLRRVDALETLAHVGHVVLDKTGTLTAATPQFAEVIAGHGVDPARAGVLVEAAAALAQWSTHPLARALAAAHPDADAACWCDVHEQRGLGLEAIDGAGRRWRLGAPQWVGGAATTGEADARVAFGPLDAAEPAIAFAFDEVLRGDAPATVQALRAAGLSLEILSGDTPRRVARIAARLGIERAEGGAAPERKLAALRAAQARGERVVMVGDGINDAPVLAQADVLVAPGDAAQLARGSADVVLLGGKLGALAEAIALARRTLRVTRQNLAWAAAYNAACVPLALVGWLPPWAAGIGMAASSALVVGNALRLAR